MKLISWNVNGLRACWVKGFADFVSRESPDILAIQETKLQPEQFSAGIDGYEVCLNSALKKGYSGTAVYFQQPPEQVACGIGIPEHDTEGRVLTLHYPSFAFVNVYTPNAQEGLKRIDYRMAWEDAFRAYLLRLDEEKPVILCGDLNVAHEEIDLKNPAANRNNAGFSDQERGKMTQLLLSGFVDTFRALYPEKRGAYSWWSYRANARQNNAGWRIDYFIVSKRILPHVQDSLILSDVYGSDHCPVCLLTEGL